MLRMQLHESIHTWHVFCFFGGLSHEPSSMMSKASHLLIIVFGFPMVNVQKRATSRATSGATPGWQETILKRT
jgi:hypothetical protein